MTDDTKRMSHVSESIQILLAQMQALLTSVQTEQYELSDRCERTFFPLSVEFTSRDGRTWQVRAMYEHSLNVTSFSDGELYVQVVGIPDLQSERSEQGGSLRGR